MICDVLVELAHVFIDKTFTYHIPQELVNSCVVGKRVEVPFGSKNYEGFVLSVRCGEKEDLKDIIRVVDDYVILNKELLEIGKYLQKTTLSSLMSCYQAMLPLALKAKSKVKKTVVYEKFLSLNNDVDLSTFKFNDSQKKIVDILLKEKVVKKQDLEFISKSSLATLIKKKIILVDAKELRSSNDLVLEKKDFVLNSEQLKVYDEVLASLGVSKTFLLYGVTGSGKTNVYMKIIQEVIRRGKQAIVLVPEISLTPQIIMRFRSMFDRIAVLHSNLSYREKYDEWRRINEGDVDIVIGARSAIFAPLSNIGLIVVDEEHSNTYKQENTPRYNAIDVAKYRSNYHNCPLILGSATPLIDDYARALKNVYQLLTLDKRYNNKPPVISIVDMNKEFKKANGYLSNVLLEKIKDRLAKDEQVILFLNRRGYSNFLSCSECGKVIKCPNCDISLTYHKSSNMLRCHYCGYAMKRPLLCSCKGELKEFGIGTEKVKEELEEKIAGVKIVRMDVDTTTRKNSHEKILEAFQRKEYQILLGTQMIAKGLDFENVTLVGVISADISLNFPDFRASETTFQLINQVAGRSGRGKVLGEVLIQTFNPSHYAIVYSKNNDYLSFYNDEMKIRKKLGYPPYYFLCSLKIVSTDYEEVKLHSKKIGDYLNKNINDAIMLGPSVANPFKVNNKYRFQIILKYKKIDSIYEAVKNIQELYFSNKKVMLEIDFNPMKL